MPINFLLLVIFSCCLILSVIYRQAQHATLLLYVVGGHSITVSRTHQCSLVLYVFDEHLSSLSKYLVSARPSPSLPRNAAANTSFASVQLPQERPGCGLDLRARTCSAGGAGADSEMETVLPRFTAAWSCGYTLCCCGTMFGPLAAGPADGSPRGAVKERCCIQVCRAPPRSCGAWDSPEDPPRRYRDHCRHGRLPRLTTLSLHGLLMSPESGGLRPR